MKNVTVVGAGTMGNGIAHVFAQNGFQVNLVDITQEALDRGLAAITKNLSRQLNKQLITEEVQQRTLSNIAVHTDLQTATNGAELIVEAATEQEDIKLEIFRKLSEYASDQAILASNTSSISITKIASVTRQPQQVIGMHFMNPVPVMKLVEVINGYATATETTSTVIDIAKKLGKVPCPANDYPGFVANRILMPMINEAIYTLHEGVAGVESVDTILKLGMAHPMGPLQLADFIGLDVCLSILKVMQGGFGQDKYAPCPLLVNMVAAGRLGVKSGEGFYKYAPGSKEKKVSSQFASK